MKSDKLNVGDRVLILTSYDIESIGKIGTIMFCSHVRYGVLLDGETRPQTNLCSEYAVYQYLKKNLKKI
jgi:hypothetical protein